MFKQPKSVTRTKKPRTNLKSAHTKKAYSSTNVKSQTTKRSARTKIDRVVNLLKQPGGATLRAIMSATQWQSHSVRGFVSGHLIKKLGLRVKSFRRDGQRVYAIKR